MRQADISEFPERLKPNVFRTDVDRLAQLPEGEFTERVRAAFERMELRSNRALAEHRDLTEREKQLSSDDHDELEALRKAEAVESTASE